MFLGRETLAIHLEEGEARAVVLKGQRVLRWASASIPSNVILSGLVEDPRALSEILGNLVRQLECRSKQPVISLGGIHQVVRVVELPRLKRELLVEAINGEMRRELASPLEEYEIHWVPIQSSGTSIRLYILAVPRNELESYSEAFRLARLRPKRINLEPMALAAIPGSQDSVIISVKDNGFNIVVARDGIPATMRDISYTVDSRTTQERSADLSREVQLTLASLYSDQGEKLDESTLFAYLVGKHAGDEYLNEYLPQETGLRFTRLVPPGTYSRDFPALEYASILGLAISISPKRWFSRSSSSGILIDLASRAGPRQSLPLVQVAGLVLIVAAMLGITNPLRESLQMNSEAEARLRAEVLGLEGSIDQVREEIGRARVINATLSDEMREGRQLESSLELISGHRFSWTDVVLDSSAAFPNVEVLGFTEDEHQLTISARSRDASQAADFANYISQIGRFISVNIESISSENQQGRINQVQFELLAIKGE